MSSLSLLNRLAKSWNTRARVCSDVDLDLQYDLTKDDFLEELLPFQHHPQFQASSPEMRSKILSCGWIAYNAKTIAIETEIVQPVCMALLAEQFNGVADALTKQLITETMVDESYHIHICVYGNEITKQHRNLPIQLPPFEFIQKMRRLQDKHSELWKKKIIQLATSIATEIYITDYLALVSKADTHSIQPLNSLIVKTHRSDEMVHGKIFDHLAKSIYFSLDKKQKQFFTKVLALPMSWLADLELDLWLSMLQQIGFARADNMINDCKQLNSSATEQTIESNGGFADLMALFHELDVDHSAYSLAP